MSALGHKRTFAVQNGMSALPPIADICSALTHVRFVPIADIISFDHLVGGDNQAGGRVNPKAFAVLRLRAVSYFVGACTGSSAGLAPRRIRST